MLIEQQIWNRFGKNDPLWAILALKDKRHNKWSLSEFFFSGKREIQNMLEYVDSLNVKYSQNLALDFGCGVGRLTQALAKHFIKVYGVDIAPSMIQQAREFNRYGSRCEYVLNCQDDLKMFPDSSFDLIYSRRVLQHIPPRFGERYIQEFVRVLKPSGILIFYMPSHTMHTWKGQVVRIFTPWTYRYTRALKLPRFEIYALQESRVISLVEASGGSMLDIRNVDDGIRKYWVNLGYCVTKSAKKESA